MRTSEGVTPSLTTLDVLISLAGYVLAYIIIFGGGFVLMRRLVRIGPAPAGASETVDHAARPMRPMSAVSNADGQATLAGGSDVP